MTPASTPAALIVDDDFMFVMHASAILTDAGYRPMEVATAEQALILLEAEDGQIDLLFTDVNMPKMDGFELARIVDRRWPAIRIVIASGYARPQPGELPHKVTFFTKPLDIDAVRTLVSKDC